MIAFENPDYLGTFLGSRYLLSADILKDFSKSAELIPGIFCKNWIPLGMVSAFLHKMRRAKRAAEKFEFLAWGSLDFLDFYCFRSIVSDFSVNLKTLIPKEFLCRADS